MKKNKSLQDVMPVYKIESDCLLSHKGDFTIAYELTLPEIFTLSTADYETLHNTWVKAIRLLPINTVVHKQDWYIQTRYNADFSSERSFLSKSSERFFNERPYLDHKCYLFITSKVSNRKNTTALSSTLITSSIVPQQSIDPKLQELFLDKASQCIKILEGYIKCRRLSADELASTIQSPGLIEQYCYLLNPSEEPVIRDMNLKDEFKIGEYYTQMFSLADVQDLPALCGPRINFEKYSTDKTKFSISFSAPLGQLLDCNHIYNQYIVIEDTQRTIQKLEKKRIRLQSLSAYSRENAISRDSVNQFLNEAISHQRQAIKAHFDLLVWTDRKEQLKEIRNNVSAALAQMDARAKIETVIAPQLFFVGMPGGAADLPLHECFDTFIEQASCFLIQETNYQSSLSPIGLRLGDRINGMPIHVDISDEPMAKGICTNRNKFILGPSGSGKSFFTNHMVRSYYEQGTHVVLVDVGHSYKGLCDLVNGYYFTYSEKDPIRFNPFYIMQGEALDTEKKESIKTLLLALWKKDDENFRRSEYIALSNALQGYCDKLESDQNIFPCFNTFYDYLQSDFIEVLKKEKVKEKDFDIDNFLFVLKPYYQGGEFDYLLNATENLDLLQQPFIVFELDNIKDHPILFPVVTIIIMEVFISKMRKLKGIRKMILIEEAWKAIAKEGMAEYIRYLFKTVRKHYGEAIVVTQEIEDIISSPIIKRAIIGSSDCKILLDQAKYQNMFTQIQELLGLTEKEKALILSMNKANDPTKKYKEVFISLGGVLSKVYRTEVSLEEYLAYTTEEKEKIKVQEYAKKYGSIQKGISVLASEIRAAV